MNVFTPVGRAPPIMCSHMMLLCASSSSRALLLLERLLIVTLFQIMGFSSRQVLSRYHHIGIRMSIFMLAQWPIAPYLLVIFQG